MKKYMTLSNAIYAFSIVFALGVLLKVYIDRFRLPEGVCPTAYNNGWIYLSIGILIVSTVITTVMDRKKKASLAEAVNNEEAVGSDDDLGSKGDDGHES